MSSISYDPFTGSYSTRPKTRRPKKAAPKAQPPANTLKGLIEQVRKDKVMGEGIRMLSERKGEFENQLNMELAGIALYPPARQYVDDQLDRIWSKEQLPKEVGEVIIGAGFHAAVYASARVAAGFPKPLVLEATQRVGGVFAVSRTPSFYLNSRNRPGRLGIPGRGEALNVLPAGPIQPSQLSGAEYQRNSDLAFAIRAALALNARVVTGYEAVVGLGMLVSGASFAFRAGRVIYATGVGKPKVLDQKHERIIPFLDFMARMDDPFPLRGMDKVAVVGAGDSGRTAIEALTGQGPSTGMSVSELDYPQRIDWYGMNIDSTNASGWENCNRSRYKGIASNLPKNRTQARIRPFTDRAVEVSGGYEGVVVNGRRYDHLIWCAGFDLSNTYGAGLPFQVGDREVARMISVLSQGYVVGPAAQLDMTPSESGVLPSAVPENTVSLFRYADRTATLAAELGPADQIRRA